MSYYEGWVDGFVIGRNRKAKNGCLDLENFKVTVSGLNVTLTWANPSFINFEKVIIVRKDTGYPTNPNDGVKVYEGNGINATDTVPTTKPYYYRGFVISKNSKNQTKFIRYYSLPVTNGCTIYFDAFQIVDKIDGDTITTLTDFSGNNNNGIGSAIYSASGINGKPAIRFDGTTSFLIPNQSSTPCTIFLVWNKPVYGGASYQRIYSSGEATDNDYKVNGIYYIPETSDNGMGTTISPLINVNKYTSSKSLINMRIGRVNYPDVSYYLGYVSEFIFYNRVLTADEENLVTNYLKDKYEIL